MASAEIKTVTETRPVEVEKVVLTLDKDEAALLSAILFCGVAGKSAMPLIEFGSPDALMNQLQRALGGTHRVATQSTANITGPPVFSPDEYF